MTDRRGARGAIRRLLGRVMRRVYRTGLIGFGRMPHVIQRYVVRIASPSYTVGAVLVLEHEGSILALRQLHRSGWTLPGGLLGQGEMPAEAVVREAREELALAVDIDPATDLPAATLIEPRAQRVDVIFHRVVDSRPSVRPRGEAFRADWLTLADLLGGRADDVTREVLRLLVRARKQ